MREVCKDRIHTINARAEIGTTAPTFRSAFKHRRCLVLADGFCEWKSAGGGQTAVSDTFNWEASQLTQRRFPEPRQCIFWHDPERVRGALRERFELIEEYVYESHLRRYLLKCRECGQLYFYEFYEDIDWQKGNDPQFTTYIPVSTLEVGTELARLTPMALLQVSPRLCIDFPKEAESSTVYWLGKHE